MKTFTAYIEWDPETKVYVGIVPGVPGAHTQGASLDELHKNLKEVLELCLEEARDAGETTDFPQFFGLHRSLRGVRLQKLKYNQLSGGGCGCGGSP